MGAISTDGLLAEVHVYNSSTVICGLHQIFGHCSANFPCRDLVCEPVDLVTYGPVEGDLVFRGTPQ